MLVKLSSSYSINLSFCDKYFSQNVFLKLKILFYNLLKMKFTSLVFVTILIVKCKCIPLDPKVASIRTSITHESIHPQFRSIPHAKLNRPEELSTDFWFNNAKDFVATKLNQPAGVGTAKNIILFIGDGMSLTTQSAARMYKGGEEESLSFEEFPYAGLIKTYVTISPESSNSN